MKRFVKGGFGVCFVGDLWKNENRKMKMESKGIVKSRICFFVFFWMFILFIFV